MSNIMSELETILGMCEYSKHKKMASELSKAEKELIAKIRNELTELAGSEDIDVVKIIKQELNKKYGVENITLSADPPLSSYELRRIRDERNITTGMSLNPDPTGRSITGTYDTNNPLNRDDTWQNKYVDPEKYKK